MTDPIVREKPSRLYTLSKILFCVVVFLFVIFTVLANMGGNSDFHRQSIEQLAAEMTGFKSKIGYLVNVTYFPTISVNFEDMDLLHGAGDVPAAHIDKMQAALAFWDVMWRTGKIKVLNVQGVEVHGGVILDKPINIRNFGIADTGDQKGVVEGQAYIGSTALVFSIDMAAEGKGRKRVYWFEPERVARVDLGDIKISTVLKNAINPYLSFQDFKIVRDGKDVLTGRLDISKRREREITIAGELKTGETVFRPDLIYDMAARKITGTISSENFRSQDFAEASLMDDLVNRFVQCLGDMEQDGKVLDEFFAAQDITLDLKGETAFQGKLKFENNTLSLSP